MRKFNHQKLWVLIFVLIGVSFLLNLKPGQAQSGSRPKIAALTCNSNNICEYEEWNSRKRPENQPCLDCRPKTYAPLLVDPNDAQMVTHGYNTSWSFYKVVQFKCIGTEIIDGEIVGNYADSWISNKTACPVPTTWAGDADNDGQKEIVAFVDASRNGKKILIYKTGSTGNPSWESPIFAKNTGGRGGIRVGDVDGDGENEVVMDIADQIWICRIVPGGQSYNFSTVWAGPSYGGLIWNIDIGDADNLGGNEIVLAMFSIGSPIILKYMDGTWASQTVDKINVSAIDVAKVRDIDNALGNGNEIIASGNNNKLMVWKYEDGVYKFEASSDDLGGFTQGVDAGDVDGDGANEIVTAATGNPNSKLYVFNYTGGSFEKITSLTINGDTGQLRTIDLDKDGTCEIALVNNGLSIFELISATRILVKRFNCIFGECFE
jgi:hypothetical protein